MDIKFSDRFRNQRFDFINNTVLNLTYVPEKDMDNDIGDKKDFSFDWKTLSFNESYLTI
jgi:hypothetical protein